MRVLAACVAWAGCAVLPACTGVSLERLPCPAAIERPAVPAPAEKQAAPVEAFRIFDEVYYLGNDWVSCYLIVTSDGLVLIDSLYGEYVPTAVRSIEALGLRPSEIRYVLITHGHWDHAGGARVFQTRYGARIAMAAADWTLAAQPPDDPRFAFEPPEEDIVLGSGETIQVGETEFHVFQTPGHTEGVLSLELLVHDGGRAHRAFVFGGVGLNFEGVERTESYLRSVELIRALADGDPPIEVNLSNHPALGRLFERAELLRARAPGAPHPFVDAPAFRDWLDELQRNAEAKLADELAR